MHKAGRAFVDMRGRGLETVGFWGGGAGSGEVSCKSEVLRGADVDTIIIHFMQGSNI